MDSQKRENILNLALDTPENERARSVELATGYDETTELWEVIVRHVGDITRLRDEGIEVVPLLSGYAILRLRREQLDIITNDGDILYIEKPKRLFFGVERGKAASCIQPLQLGEAVQGALPQIYGRGVIVAVADSGIDILHPAFRNADGSTRIVRIWDQTKAAADEYPSPFDYMRGREYTKEQIDELIKSFERGEINRSELPALDNSGHGTSVAGIATGSSVVRGVAPESDIIVVKLGLSGENDFPRTTELMMAVDYIVRTSLELNKPVAVNLSIGNTYGSHDGTALLETYLEAVSDIGRNVIVVGSGNEGSAGGHTSGILVINEEEKIELVVSTFETRLSLQIWKYYADVFTVMIEAPDGTRVGPLGEILNTSQYTVGDTKLLVYYGEPAPYSSAQEIYIEFIPVADGGYINSGVWTIRLNPTRIVDGEYHMWLPENSVNNINTRFLRPTPGVTLTVPGTAAKVITVGAYDALLGSYADFSGRGFTRVERRIKPEIVAPGVGVVTAATGGGTTSVSGTSFATPFVTGGAALLMEWGIVNGNDRFLYGEKVKAYLIRGARQLAGEETPSPKTGWGALCVADSLPV
ncbi:MAG: S8 family serine peptidase [Lachnospiraceae bacterium]|nr:S8 family serine peptidase [Lachnospiraceae bacterium]